MDYVKSCSAIMMPIGIGSTCAGDLNCDQSVNVLDVVILASCVLQQCASENYWCSTCNTMEWAGSAPFNLADIVILANCILDNNCDDL